ncbi:hypothetical protein, partial [Flavobacterium sp.]|uniref:hypothetical protein n=1 Tax=Flavobacterium sp. TaxID=239 RepID=UPI0037BF0EEC
SRKNEKSRQQCITPSPALIHNPEVKQSLTGLVELSGTDTSRNRDVFSRLGYGSLADSANNLG